MDSFSKAVEAMANLPTKGHIPSTSEVDRVAAAAKNLVKGEGPIDPANGRFLPTKEEIASIVAAAKKA